MKNRFEAMKDIAVGIVALQAHVTEHESELSGEHRALINASLMRAVNICAVLISIDPEASEQTPAPDPRPKLELVK